MFDIRVNVDLTGIERKLTSLATLNARVSGLMNRLGVVGTQALQDNFRRQEDSNGVKWPISLRAKEEGGLTLVDTGAMSNINYGALTVNKIWVGSEVPYAKCHTTGRPTPIYPKNAKALSFFIGNRRVVTQRTSGYPKREWAYITDVWKNKLYKTAKQWGAEQLK